MFDFVLLLRKTIKDSIFMAMEKKKLLMVCEAFGGGVFAYVSQLCNDMCEDFDVYLAYALRPQTPKNYMDAMDPRVHMIEVKTFGGRLTNFFQDAQAVNELKKIARTVKPNIIHLHSSIAGGVGRIAFKSCKKYKVVYTPHGYAHILMGEPDSMSCRLYKLMELALGKRNCITLTCCESEDEEAKKLTKRTAYVETGVNVADLSATIDPIVPEKQEKFTVYAMGRMCVQKQPDLFNEIALRVPEANFVWVGTGELKNQLTAPNLKITGWKPRHEAIAMGKGADVYILCSLGEAIAMSLIENMYMGKLCMVSNVMGNKSVIKDGVNGFVCSTVDDYVRHIKEAMVSFPHQLANQAAKDVREYYNTERMKRDYVKFYNDAIAGKFN